MWVRKGSQRGGKEVDKAHQGGLAFAMVILASSKIRSQAKRYLQSSLDSSLCRPYSPFKSIWKRAAAQVTMEVTMEWGSSFPAGGKRTLRQESQISKTGRYFISFGAL